MVLIGIILLTLPCYCAGVIALVMAPDGNSIVEEAPPTLPVIISPTASNTAVPEAPPGTLTAVPTSTLLATPTDAGPLPPTPDQFDTATPQPTPSS